MAPVDTDKLVGCLREGAESASVRPVRVTTSLHKKSEKAERTKLTRHSG